MKKPKNPIKDNYYQRKEQNMPTGSSSRDAEMDEMRYNLMKLQDKLKMQERLEALKSVSSFDPSASLTVPSSTYSLGTVAGDYNTSISYADLISSPYVSTTSAFSYGTYVPSVKVTHERMVDADSFLMEIEGLQSHIAQMHSRA